MNTEEDVKWEDQPWFLRGQIEGGIELGERLTQDYRDCVVAQEIADRRFNRNDPEAWEKTVNVLVKNAFVLGHMVSGASTLGYPEARNLFEKWSK